MKKIKIRVVLCDELEEEELSEGQFEIPETNRINISEIERLFLNTEKPLIRKSIAECLESISKKKLKLSQKKMEVMSLKIKPTIKSIQK